MQAPVIDPLLEIQQGWLNGPVAWGRPVDVLVREDGSLLISDDKAGMIYRVDYRSKMPRRTSPAID